MAGLNAFVAMATLSFKITVPFFYLLAALACFHRNSAEWICQVQKKFKDLQAQRDGFGS